MMAQDSTSSSLEHFNLVDCELVVCDDNNIQSSFEVLPAEEDINNLEESSSFYIQEAQYILPVNNLQEYIVKNQVAVKYAEEETNQSDQTIIYCTPEQYAAYSQIYSQDEDQDSTTIVVDQDVASTEDADNLQIISEPENMSEMEEDSNESTSTVEYIPYDELEQRSNYQYAVLKNGRLHLQTLNVEDDHKSYLKQQLEAFQASISFDKVKKEYASLDINKITGKNLITGQTVTLEKYVNKLISNDYINKRIVIGKTSNGKKLVGKILHVQKGGSDKDDDKVQIFKNQSDVKKPNENLKKPRKNMIGNSIIETVGNVLAGLMNLQNIRQQLHNKEIVVKLFRSTNNMDDGIFVKNVFLVYGYMENIKEQWSFVGTKIEDYKTYDSDEIEEDCKQEQNKHVEDDSIPKKPDVIKAVHLTLLIVINKDGKTTTKIHFQPNSSNSDQSTNGIEIQIHNKLFGCDNCFKTFENENLLFHHKKIHQIQRWENTVCSVCDKTFNSPGSLKRHFTIHNPLLRQLQCTVCLQRFTDQSSLRKHLLIHTGIRAFVCKVCHRSFVNQSDLTFHTRIHDPVKLFVCEVCGREFSRQSNLFRHSEIHRGESALFQCHICGCSYSFPSSLTRHIVHKHLGNFTTTTQT